MASWLHGFMGTETEPKRFMTSLPIPPFPPRKLVTTAVGMLELEMDGTKESFHENCAPLPLPPLLANPMQNKTLIYYFAVKKQIPKPLNIIIRQV